MIKKLLLRSSLEKPNTLTLALSPQGRVPKAFGIEGRG